MTCRSGIVALGALLTLAGCGRDAAPPPRADDPVPQPKLASTISVPIDADPRALATAVERAVPRVLWTIDRKLDACVAPRPIKVFGRALGKTPKIACTITGQVTRGPIRLRGVGREIVADVPLHAQITARDARRVLKGETATGTALAHARITLDIAPDWTPRGTVRLTYDWTKPPGIDVLGQRITFTDDADAKLKPIARQLERELPRELAKIDLRRQVAALWRTGFTTVLLNEQRPPVWMRIAPQRLHYRNYELSGGALRLNLALDAVTETFVGHRPADPKPTPLPPLARGGTTPGLRFFLPVVADYAQLEPVVARALAKRAQRPFEIPGAAPLSARFERIRIYGSPGGRIAVGLGLTAWPVEEPGRQTHGTIWLSAIPVNTPGSAQVGFQGLTVGGDTDRLTGDTLLAIGNSPGLAQTIAGALGQNFTRDLSGLVGKVQVAIADRRIGDFAINARLSQVETGRILAFGQGLYLPVRVSGDARIRYRPR